MNRVFVIEPPTVDISPARAYGQIVILFPSGLQKSPLDTDYYAGKVIAALREHQFDKDKDVLCLVGSMTSMAVLTAAMVARYKAFKSLIFNAEQKHYVLRVLGRWREVRRWLTPKDAADELIKDQNDGKDIHSERPTNPS